MKDTVLVPESGVRTQATLTDFVELTKPRITLMVVLTAAVGFFMGSAGPVSVPGLLFTVLGTAMVAAGAGVLNQVVEREADARMVRTSRRAIPAGRVTPEQGTWFGLVLGIGGIALMLVFLRPVVAGLAAITLASYVLIYTPLKRITSLNTLIGAVPGALPPVGGWAAASGRLPSEAWSLFLILFLWQIPHFLAIAWLLREDYVKGGFKMLTVGDTAGAVTGRHIALSALALVPVSLLPSILGLSGNVYFLGALLLSMLYAGTSFWAAIRLSAVRARCLFLASVIYLPALLAVMLLDRLPA